jgi:multiple sugar transport system ATP-binding protein
MARVTLENVGKSYGPGFVAVHGIDLDIADREFVVLVGPSGCGKSTTLRMIAGLEEISSGKISIGDRVVNQLPARQRDVAMVFQNYALYPHLTVFENMAFGLQLRKAPKEEIRKRVQEAARILGLDALLDRHPRALSGGQRQRVAMGRAIVRHPSAFLFDEPLSNLDAELRMQMRGEIKRVHQAVDTTTIYVTHDQVEAMTLADRVVVMRKGRIEQVGAPQAIYRNPASQFVAGFIGSPGMNFIPARIMAEGDGIFVLLGPNAPITIPHAFYDRFAPHIGKAVTFGIRPEHLQPPQEFARGHFGPVDAKVQLVEPLGTEAILHVEVAGSAAISRSTLDVLPRQGEVIRLAIALEHAKLFDPQSGLAI